MCLKKALLMAVLGCIISTVLFGQTIAGVSAGTGMGIVKHNFTYSGEQSELSYTAPGVIVEGELAWGNWYINMALSMLFSPFSATLGDDEVNLENYSLNMALDFTAIGIGYMYPVSDKITIGGAAGFHVSSISLSPPTDDSDLITLEGYYGLIGFSFVPRLRYLLNDKIAITLSIPLGIDIGAMSDEVVTIEGATGKSNPAIIRPVELVPEFTGFTAGLYISIGYFFPI